MAMSIEEIRGVQLGVLTRFDGLCRTYGLTYYLAYGTLLGAVRHGGYVPWDDDVDVMMPRADYKRLAGAFATARPEHLSLGSPHTRADWPFPYAKVVDDRTELWEPLEDPLPLGVNLDVFPIDALPASGRVRRVQTPLLRLLRWAVELRYIDAERGRGWHHPLALALGKPLLRLVPVPALVATFSRVAAAGRSPGDRAGVRIGSFDWSVPASELGVPMELEFEHLRLLAPAAPGAVLTALYGDYQRLPPETERFSHHAFTAAWHPGHPANRNPEG